MPNKQKFIVILLAILVDTNKIIGMKWYVFDVSLNVYVFFLGGWL